MSEITIPGLDNKAIPELTDLLEISANPGSFNITIGSLANIYQAISEKGAADGYAALDSSQELLLANFPTGAALQVLRRNAANDALEFATGGAGAIISINSDSTPDQIIAAGTGLGIVDTGATHTLSIDSTVVTLTDAQVLENKTLVTPTIASFINAAHNHEDAAGGGTLVATNALTATGTKDSSTFLRGDDTWSVPAGGGDVVGPASSVDNTLVRFNGVSGKLIQESGITINDDDDVLDIGSLQFVNLLAAPTSGAYIALVDDDLDINVAAGNDLNIEVNDVSEYRFNATLSAWNGNDMVNMGNLSFDDTNTFLEQDGLNIELGLATGGEFKIRINGILEYQITEERIAFHGNHITDLDSIRNEFGERELTFGLHVGAINYIQLDNATTGNGPSLRTFSEGADTDVDFNFEAFGNGTINLLSDVTMGLNKLQFNDVNTFLEQDGLNIELGLATGGEFKIRINGILEYQITEERIAFHGNHITDLDSIRNEFGERELTFGLHVGAINYIQLDNATTGNGPSLRTFSEGADTDVDFNFEAFGNGTINLLSDVTMGLNELQFNDTDTFFHQVGIILHLEIASGAQFIINIDGATQYQFLEERANFHGNYVEDIMSIRNKFGEFQLGFGTTTGSVNYLELDSGTTGVGPILKTMTEGIDTDVDFNIDTLGLGTINLLSQVDVSENITFLNSTITPPSNTTYIRETDAEFTFNKKVVGTSQYEFMLNGTEALLISSDGFFDFFENYIRKLESIRDAGDERILQFIGVASAANYLRLTNSISGNGPILETITTSGDPDVDFNIGTVGDGTINLLASTVLSGDLIMGDNLITTIKGTQFAQETLAYNATQIFDFDDNQYQTIPITGDLTTLSTTSRAAGKAKTVIIIGDTVNRTLTFNASWKTSPSTTTFEILANSVAVMSLYAKGGSESDIICAIHGFE